MTKLLLALTIGLSFYACCCTAALRRTPKVYNALITTDENLVTSRAYPVIQPTIHETGLANYPFSPFYPYGFFNPFPRLGQPIVPGLNTGQQPQYQLPEFAPQLIHQPAPPSTLLTPQEEQPQPQNPPPYVDPATPNNLIDQQPNELSFTPTPPPPQPTLPPTTAIPPTAPELAPNENLSIPLNEFGYPPSLIPLPTTPGQNNEPVHLAPYNYQQYPLIYNPVAAFREEYLPPYKYFPPYDYNYPTFSAPVQGRPETPSTPLVPTTESMPPMPTTNTEPAANEGDNLASFESIKNGSKSRDSAVPDVPPPPIPSGAKSQN